MNTFFRWVHKSINTFNYMKVVIASSNEFIYDMIDKYKKIPISDFKIIEIGDLSKEMAQ